MWSPHHDYLKETVEGVQRRATKKLPGMYDLEYPERLRKLKLPTLAIDNDNPLWVIIGYHGLSCFLCENSKSKKKFQQNF